MFYQVYFEIYGKKLVVKIDAANAPAAAKQVRDALVFHKIVKEEQPINNPFEGIFGNLFGKDDIWKL
jgi:hypothetical protein